MFTHSWQCLMDQGILMEWSRWENNHSNISFLLGLKISTKCSSRQILSHIILWPKLVYSHWNLRLMEKHGAFDKGSWNLASICSIHIPSSLLVDGQKPLMRIILPWAKVSTQLFCGLLDSDSELTLTLSDRKTPKAHSCQWV